MKQINSLFWVSMAAFLVLIALQTWMFEKTNMFHLVEILVAVMPILPLFWTFFIYRRHFREMDEYLRRVTGEAFLWMVGVVSFSTFAYGMLIMKLEYPPFNIAFILPLTFGGHGLLTELLLWIDKNEE